MKYSDDLNYRELLIAFLIEKKIVTSILKGQEKYSELLEALNKYDIDDYKPLPKQKDLLKALEMKREDLIALMREMYDKFCTCISRDGSYPIKRTEINICASNVYDEHWVLSPDNLAFIPNIGDWMTIPFFRDQLGGGHFKVKEVSHEIENQKHIINIIVDDDLKSKD